MIQLAYGCTCSELKVNPSNWRTSRASIKKDWYVYYRFYDPVYKESKYTKGKLVIIKGMNHFKTFEGQQQATFSLVEKN